jgi:hypothetical protein
VPDDDHYYAPLGGNRFRPSRHVQGAWREDEQHMSPVAGLLAQAVARHEPRPELQVARISYDILGLIPLQDSDVTVRTVRPGRTIELVEATLSVAGRDCVRATAWRLVRQDTAEVAGGSPPALAAPDQVPEATSAGVWGGGYIASLHQRRTADSGRGHARAWLRTDVRLVAGEDVDPLARFVGLVDTANGIAVREHPADWMFPNVDLTVHVFRTPQGPWVGFDTTVTFGATGLGLTSSWLHDELGPVGRAEQSLTVRPIHA